MGRLIVTVAGMILLLVGPAWADACGEWRLAVRALDLAGEPFEKTQDKSAALALSLTAYSAVKEAERKVAAEAPDKLAREALAALVPLPNTVGRALSAVVHWGLGRRTRNMLPIVASLRVALNSLEEARELALKHACP